MRAEFAILLMFSAVSAAAGCGDSDSADGTSTTTGGGGSGAAGGGGAGADGGMGGDGGGGGGQGGEGGADPLAVSVEFEAYVGAEAFDCASTYADLGTTDATFSFRDFRFYVHDVRLLEAGTGAEVPVELTQDELWQYTPEDGTDEDGVVLLDFEDNTGSCQNGTTPTNLAVVGSVPAGTYDGIVFKLGVPALLNHADVAVAPSPLNLSALFWNWNGGYKFLRIDGVAEGSKDPFNMHLGSTMCTGDATMGEEVVCANPNVPEITLMGFDPATHRIRLDYAAIVANSDVTINQAGAAGCQSFPSDPDCDEPFAAIGLDYTDGSLTGTQTAFSVQ